MGKLGPYELNQIYTGDAIDLAEAIPNQSIDIVFTSPPYNVGLDYGTYKDDIPEDQFWEFQSNWLRDAYRISSEGARLYLVVGDNMLWRIRDIAQELGWRYHQLLAWCKPNLVSRGRISKDWNLLAEWCLLFHKGKRTSMLSGMGTTFNWIVAASCQSNFRGNKHKVHPAQMALEVATKWLSRTPGRIVYEPFAGSGTTCQSAKLLGRSFLAFEIDPETAELARQRVAQMQPLFVPEITQIEMDILSK